MNGQALAPVPNRGMISASLDQIAWALTSYIVCAVSMMPLTGWLAGRFGIKYIFLASVNPPERHGPKPPIRPLSATPNSRI